MKIKVINKFGVAILAAFVLAFSCMIVAFGKTSEVAKAEESNVNVVGLSAAVLAKQPNNAGYPYVKVSIIVDQKVTNQPDGNWGADFMGQIDQPTFDGVFNGIRINGRYFKEIAKQTTKWMDNNQYPIKMAEVKKYSNGTWGIEIEISQEQHHHTFGADAANNQQFVDYLFKFDGTDKIDIMPTFSTANGAAKIANPGRYVLKSFNPPISGAGNYIVNTDAAVTGVDFSVVSADFTRENLPTVSSLAVSGSHKIEYVSGENFSTENIVVSATMSDGTVVPADISRCVFSGYDKFAAAGVQTITVNYENKTTTYDVTVTSNGVSDYVVTPPTNVHLYVGQEINKNQIVVNATKNSVSTILEPSEFDFTYDNKILGIQDAKVRVNGIEKTFKARFYEAPTDKTVFIGVTDVKRALTGDTAFVEFTLLFNQKVVDTADGSEPGLWGKVSNAKYNGIFDGILINGVPFRTIQTMTTIDGGAIFAPDGVNPIKDCGITHVSENVWGVNIQMSAMNYTNGREGNNLNYSTTEHFLRFDGTDKISVTENFKTAYTDNAMNVVNPSEVTLQYADPITKVADGTTTATKYPNWTQNHDTSIGEGWITNQKKIVLPESMTYDISKTSYVVGQAFDIDSISNIQVVMSDESVETPSIDDVIVSGFSSENVGANVISVKYKDFVKTTELTILAKAVTRISVTTEPTKTSYKNGEELDMTGLAVTVYYNDGSNASLSVSDITVSGYDKTKAGKQTITLTYSEQSATFDVVVAEAIVPETPKEKGCAGAASAILFTLLALGAVSFIVKKR